MNHQKIEWWRVDPQKSAGGIKRRAASALQALAQTNKGKDAEIGVIYHVK